MYNLAKLLVEEPEKLERLFFIFLKILITLFISCILFGFNLSITEFVEKLIPQNYTISKLIYFIVITIIVWLVIWNIIAEIILGECVIWLLSKIGNKKIIFNEVLGLLKVVKIKNNNISPEKNIITFNELLQSYSKDGEKYIKESKSRTRQYYAITTVIYLSMFFANDIVFPNWLKLVGGILIFNFLLSSITLHQIHSLFSENLEEMKKQFSRLSYAQMVINSIENNSFITQHYKRLGHWTRIKLERKTDVDWLPETIKFYPFYYWNELLTKMILDKDLQQIAENYSKYERKNTYDVLISNVELSKDNINNILANPQFVYMYCQNEENILKNIDVLLFKITNGNYHIA